MHMPSGFILGPIMARANVAASHKVKRGEGRQERAAAGFNSRPISRGKKQPRGNSGQGHCLDDERVECGTTRATTTREKDGQFEWGTVAQPTTHSTHQRVRLKGGLDCRKTPMTDGGAV